MAKFKIQAYNQEMKELVEEYDKDFERTEEALIECYYLSTTPCCYDVVVLMRQSLMDKRCWNLVAKFY